MPRRPLVLQSALVFLACAVSAEAVVIVSDDGQRRQARPASEAGISAWPSRLAPAVKPGERLDLRANLPAGVTAAEEARWKSARPVPGYAGAESVIGSDQRKKVTNTKTYPYRAVVQILFSPKESEATFLCSGNLINENTVLTAGHCIHEGAGGDFYENYTVYPGRNAGQLPFGSCTVATKYTNTGWVDLGGTVAGQAHDFGALKLNCDIGDTTGWFGFFWQSKTLKNLNSTISGYPGDKTFGTQWKGTGKVTVSQGQQTFYSIDTAGGQSGSGVYINKTGCGTCIHSIHAYGVGGPSPGNKNNSGTRINQSEFDFFVDILDD